MSSSGSRVVPRAESPFRLDALKGQVLLISGGSSGIGLDIARQVGRHGACVMLMGRRADVLQQAIQSLRAEHITCDGETGDVRKLPDCQRLVESTVAKFGHLSILCNCAAGNFLSTAEQLKPKGFQTVMEIDTIGVFNMCHAAFPHLKSRAAVTGDSLIINISATLHYGATWYQSAPSAAKAAIDSLTRSLALEWGEFGIRCVGIAPGPIGDTAGFSKLGGDALGADAVTQTVPLGRLGRTWDIAMCAVYLSSLAGAFVSGDTIVVDGASWMWRPQLAPREMIQQLSRRSESVSRQVGTAKL
jgi:peroxisomal 2,4-dienoyl-CoA reductase